jgi:hypothetical protein
MRWRRMSVIEEIQRRLGKYPEARYEQEGSAIRVLPEEGGFEVGLAAHERGCTVFFNGWHEEFADESRALECFAFGLSEECRLKEWRRGGTAYKWTVEYLEGDEWVEDSTTGLIFIPFWKPPEIVCLQNHLIPKVPAVGEPGTPGSLAWRPGD